MNPWIVQNNHHPGGLVKINLKTQELLAPCVFPLVPTLTLDWRGG